MVFNINPVNFFKKIIFFALGFYRYLPFKRNVIIDKTGIKKILVIESGGIGDLLRVFPVLECFIANFPGAEISVLVSPLAKDMLGLFPAKGFISEIIDYDLNDEHKSFWKKIQLIMDLRKKHFDLIYSPGRGVGMREQAILSFLTGARYRLGFKWDRKGFLNTVEVEFRDDIPILKQNLAIIQASGIEVSHSEIQLHIPEDDLIMAENILKVRNFKDSYPIISIHPGSSWHEGFCGWPLDKYISLIKRLISELDAKIIVIGDEREKATWEKRIEEINSDNVISAIGKTTVNQMVALINFSDIFIGNDSGPLHIALALGKKSIGIFGPTSPEQVLTPIDNCIVLKKDIYCSPCYLHQYDFVSDCVDKKCLQLITIDEVVAGVKGLL